MARQLTGKNDPHRLPSWRIERVKELVDDPFGVRPARRSDDKYIKRMKSFRVRWQAALGDDGELEALYAEYAECAIAQQLAEGRGNPTKAGTTTLIEARLLARQSFEEVAAVTGTSAAAIEWYEALYFNVTDRLDVRDWITQQVLIPAVADQVKAARSASGSGVGPVAYPFLDGTIKLFGYFCGSRTVDAMASGFTAFQTLRTDAELEAWYDDHWRRTIRRRSVQAAQTFEINKFNVTELFAVHLRVIDLEQSPGAQRKAKTDFEARLKAAIDCLPYSPAVLSGGDFRPGNLRAIDQLAIEPSAMEAARLAAGEPVEQVLDAEILDMTMPPPRRQTVVDKS